MNKIKLVSDDVISDEVQKEIFKQCERLSKIENHDLEIVGDYDVKAYSHFIEDDDIPVMSNEEILKALMD